MARPILKSPYSLPEKVLQALSFITLLGILLLTFYSFITLPAKIPTHFGFDGRPDAWGGKSALLLLPIFSAVFYAALTVLERFPQIYNYPVEITEQNAAAQYKLGRLLIECLKLILPAVFLYIQWATARAAAGSVFGFGFWFLPVTLILMFGTTGIILFKMVKSK